MLAVLGIVFAAFFFVVSRQVLAIVQKPSWPPAADAITAAGAQQAVEAFAARSDPRPSDVGMPYAWSTAATIEPWPEGKNFFPKIFDDVRAAHSSVHILMFGWREGEVGTQLSDLLIEKMKQGVEVRVIVDAAGSKPFGPAEADVHAAGGLPERRSSSTTPSRGTGTASTPTTAPSTGARTRSAGPTTASST